MIETNHSKHNKIFRGILSNISLCLSPSSETVNFNADVKCEEVCVCCQHILRWVRDYIKHAEQHQNVSMIKTTYINQMCDELCKQAVDKLNLTEHFSHIERGNKRVCEIKDIESRTSEVWRVKLHRVDVINELNFQPVNDIDPLKMSSLSSHQIRCTYRCLLLTVSDSTYTSFKCYWTHS